MNTETLANVILAWCACITLAGSITLLITRHSQNRVRKAIKSVEDRMHEAEQKLVRLQARYVRVRVYARRLYDYIKTAGGQPPEPPDEFYE